MQLNSFTDSHYGLQWVWHDTQWMRFQLLTVYVLQAHDLYWMILNEDELFITKFDVQCENLSGLETVLPTVFVESSCQSKWSVCLKVVFFHILRIMTCLFALRCLHLIHRLQLTGLPSMDLEVRKIVHMHWQVLLRPACLACFQKAAGYQFN